MTEMETFNFSPDSQVSQKPQLIIDENQTHNQNDHQENKKINHSLDDQSNQDANQNQNQNQNKILPLPSELLDSSSSLENTSNISNISKLEPSEKTETNELSPKERVPRLPNPVLQQLVILYPVLFGEKPLPLKRGIYADLQAAHPTLCDSEALKQALGFHTRSTRYLNAVASGQPRYDLQGQVVEKMSPEHVFHALLEVFKRRQQRAQNNQNNPNNRQHSAQTHQGYLRHQRHQTNQPERLEDLPVKLRTRMMYAFEASGLSKEEYLERMHNKDQNVNEQLQLALNQWSEQAAREEALLRAFESNQQTELAFAEMYGLHPKRVNFMLNRARARQNNQAI